MDMLKFKAQDCPTRYIDAMTAAAVEILTPLGVTKSVTVTFTPSLIAGWTDLVPDLSGTTYTLDRIDGDPLKIIAESGTSVDL